MKFIKYLTELKLEKTNLQPSFEDISPKPLNKCLQSVTAVSTTSHLPQFGLSVNLGNFRAEISSKSCEGVFS